MLDAPLTDTPTFLEDLPGNRGGWPLPHTDVPVTSKTEEKPTQLARTSDEIGRKISDIAAGRSSGEHPALDRLVGPQNPHWPDTVCRPDCPRRSQPQQQAPAPRQIVDVYPSLPERVYGLERDVQYIQQDIKQHREDSIRHSERVASKESLNDLEKAVWTELSSINERIYRRTVAQVVQVVALILSSAYALILSYQHFITR